jgi:cell wall-associated NlpC family hydrolase
MTAAALAAAAKVLVGTRFRLHGRDPATGLDCIGLFGAAMAASGRPLTLPTGYPLRLRALHGWLPDPAELGFTATEPPFAPGDVVMLVPGPAQFHLAIAAPDLGWVHAHAGLRKVVHDAALPMGTLIHHWRLLPAN